MTRRVRWVEATPVTGRLNAAPPESGLTRWEIAQAIAGGFVMFLLFLAIMFVLGML